MTESRQSLIAKLRETVRRKRSALDALKLAKRNAPERMRESFGAKIDDLEHELQKHENELHELNVQQIRHELGHDSKPPDR